MSNPLHSSLEHLAGVLQQCQGEIIAEWRLQAGKLLSALHLDQPTMTDHMPDVVAEIARDLSLNRDGTLSAEHLRGSPPVHGVQRFYDGLDVDEVVAEYNLLRTAFHTVAERHGLTVAGEAAHIINHRIDEAVRLAVAAFAAQQELIRREQQAEHLAFIAHDLRTPLNAVSLLVEELKFGLDEPSVAANDDLFAGLKRNLQSLERLVKKVLDAHLEPSASGSSFRPEVRPFELWPLVQRLIVDLRPVAAQSGITVRNEIPRTLSACADAGLVSQVFQNLLGNAFKYAPQGCVSVRAEADAEMVICTVNDNGAGIPPEMLDKVFDKLAHDPGKDGQGLGLTIVKQIVEAHGGSVSVESLPGQGATFRFTLPAAQPS